jgi:hypothetical protein
MADLLGDGMFKVTWCSTIANIAAPTVAELNAGTPLELLITPDGLKIDPDTASVDTSSLGSTFNTASAGRRSFSPAIMFKHQTPTDTAFDLLPYRTSGFLVVRRNLIATTAWTASQKVAVYPMQVGEPKETTPAPNAVQTFESPMMVTSDPNTRAVVA